MKYLFALFILLQCCKVVDANDSLRLLENEKVALQCKLDLILHATHSLSLSYYAINEDEVGLRYTAALCYKAQQGVKVKIIIEKSRSKITKSFVRLCKDYGIEIKYYNTFNFIKGIKNFSWLHDKLLVIDSSYTILGGRNLNDKYYPNKQKRTELDDVETLIKGQAGADAHKYINHLFTSQFASDVSVPRKEVDPVRYKKLKKTIDSNIVELRKITAKDWDSLLFPVSNVKFINDNYSKWPKTKRISDTILSSIKNTKKSFVAVSPYLIPPLRFMKQLKKANKRGVKITLISNSPQVSDAKIIAAAYMNDRRKYLKRNIKVYEYNGPKMVHDKIFLIDDSIAIVGSYNFDNISYRMNSEVIATIKDAAFGKKLQQHIAIRLEKCTEIKNKRDRNPACDKKTIRRAKASQFLLRIFPFIRRFL